MPTDIPSLNYGTYYHIYNRGNTHENIFLQERNYSYFMELWWKHLSPIAETWAYCLLGNHFHAAVYIKNQADLSGLTRGSTSPRSRVDQGLTHPDSSEDLTGLKKPHQYFSNFFNAYTRGVNLATRRTGTLFERPFKRIPVDSTSYLMRLVVYIHQNPQKHTFVNDFCRWNYSSYHELIGNVPTRLQRERILQLFGSWDDFARIHQEIQPLPGFEDEE